MWWFLGNISIDLVYEINLENIIIQAFLRIKWYRIQTHLIMQESL